MADDGRSPECRNFKGETRPEEYRQGGYDRPALSLDEPAPNAYSHSKGNARHFRAAVTAWTLGSRLCGSTFRHSWTSTDQRQREPGPQCLMKGTVSPMCFFCCLSDFFSFGVCCGFFLLCFGG